MAERTVLVVDDSVAVRRAVCLMLSGGEYRCVEAADGKQALDALTTQQVDVVLTDLNMPVMNGFQFIEAMRAEAAHRFTPVLVLTTEGREDVVSDLKRRGVTGVLQKPIDRDQLLSAMRRTAG